MEAYAAFVRAYGVVVLYAVAHVRLHVALVVHPCHTEGDDAVGDAQAFNEVGAVEFGVTVVLVLDCAEDLADGLYILRLVGEALLQTLHGF